MVTAKQVSIRLADEDVAILDAIMQRTGLVSRSDALRFSLRQYAIAQGLAFSQPTHRAKGKLKR